MAEILCTPLPEHRQPLSRNEKPSEFKSSSKTMTKAERGVLLHISSSCPVTDHLLFTALSVNSLRPFSLCSPAAFSRRHCLTKFQILQNIFGEQQSVENNKVHLLKQPTVLKYTFETLVLIFSWQTQNVLISLNIFMFQLSFDKKSCQKKTNKKENAAV